MKFFATALISIASASKVHDFFAERNFICGMCKTVFEAAYEGDDQKV
jgi:hypothetical protein